MSLNKLTRKPSFCQHKLPVAMAAAFALMPFSQGMAKLSMENMTRDITYLASDELRGRASFSPEIDQAADYISKRFTDIGLRPMAGNTGFKQSFSIYSISQKSLKVSLNSQVIDKENLVMASTMPTFSWQQNDAVKTHVVGEKDNLRDTLRKLNQEGGQHLVLLHPAQKALFERYRHYFNRGLTKLELGHQGAIVIALTDISKLNKLDITGTTETKQQRLTNVVGILPGKSKAKEIVLYSAHYDHIGVNSEGEGDVINNGADDDASGTTAMINLAEHFAQQNDNARTLMFSAFTAEEIGGFGSRAFSKQLDPEQVVAMINIEMIGKPSKFGPGTVWMTGMERSDLGELLNRQIKEEKDKIHQDPYPEQGLFYRSDNATLARLGVPAHSFSSTQLDKDQHYHQVSDDLASLDLDSMFKVIQTLAAGTRGLVNGSVTPSRIDPAKVKGSGLIY
ncbi:M20/M25/M40 family metallo-hydrolase [Thalassomonas haliotis]|uniref:M20/M25/M40 family metallo-hydrolase n=1 Tax=Thalassomonas haliotis TaxID=485448 RepID=A0ABY7VBU2_9GAMM|nr:M20/M25/M40 family metallo-hydrolase [Thalassomonas haliotis]WDE10373.1 M20/M25/M40 family metallo-hydrolase [Thalassomonas haliotis]